MTLIRAVPSLIAGPAAGFDRKVPGDFFTADVEDDGTPVMVIACPCGQAPRVPVSRSVRCECERVYLATSASVFVGNSPHRTPEAPTPVVN